MSVTFEVESLPTGTFYAECLITGRTLVQGATLEAARQVADMHEAYCEGCRAYHTTVRHDIDVDVPIVNMANTNARRLLIALDLPYDDLCGSEDGPTFLARVLVALATDRDDDEIPAVELPTPGHATMIDCGARAGYVYARLIELHALASEAVVLGREIFWS